MPQKHRKTVLKYMDKQTSYVRVRLSDLDRTSEWREVEATSLEEAIKIVEGQEDVEVVLESSWTPGGVLT